MFLQSFYVEATKDNIVLIKQVLHTLIEMSVVSNFYTTKIALVGVSVNRAISSTSKFFLTTKYWIQSIESYRLLSSRDVP